ncbi:MAG: hypothetical protein AB7G25_08005 [Sphingomonadaceae bacterium]
MSLTFAQVEFALAFATGIAPERRDSFVSRLKQWQKMGFPEGVNVGRGVKASYGASQAYQLMIMLKLLSVGLTPERAQRVVISGWDAFKDAIIETTVCLANRETHQHYCMIKLDALSDLKPGNASHMHIFVDLFIGDEIAEAFNEPDADWPEDEKILHKYHSVTVKDKMAVSISLEIDSMLIMFWGALRAMDISPEIFADEMFEWESRRRAEGRAPQEGEGHFDAQFASRSIAQHVTNFDVAGAAQKALAKVISNGDDQKA